MLLKVKASCILYLYPTEDVSYFKMAKQFPIRIYFVFPKMATCRCDPILMF